MPLRCQARACGLASRAALSRAGADVWMWASEATKLVRSANVQKGAQTSSYDREAMNSSMKSRTSSRSKRKGPPPATQFALRT